MQKSAIPRTTAVQNVRICQRKWDSEPRAAHRIAPRIVHEYRDDRWQAEDEGADHRRARGDADEAGERVQRVHHVGVSGLGVLIIHGRHSTTAIGETRDAHQAFPRIADFDAPHLAARAQVNRRAPCRSPGRP